MTREEAIQVLRDWDGYFIGHSSDDVNGALNMAIQALEQEPKQYFPDDVLNCWIGAEVLDKIRAEIQGLRNCSCSCSDGIIDDVEDIIDKYKAEGSEG